MGSVSVVIRNRNEATSLAKVLASLAAQRMQPVETILVDNGSRDASRSVAEAHGARIINIVKEEFTYGRALNMGIEAARGEFILMLSAHSMPIGRFFIEQAIEPFSDQRVAAVRCHMTAKAMEMEKWMTPRILDSNSTIEAVIECGPIASGSVIRRNLWEEVRFDETLEAVEDKFWGWRILQMGYRISWSEAIYFYMRNRSFWERVQARNREWLAFYRATGHTWRKPKTSLARLATAALIKAPYAGALVLAQELVQYISQKSIPLQAMRKPKAGSIQ